FRSLLAAADRVGADDRRVLLRAVVALREAEVRRHVPGPVLEALRFHCSGLLGRSGPPRGGGPVCCRAGRVLTGGRVVRASPRRRRGGPPVGGAAGLAGMRWRGPLR